MDVSMHACMRMRVGDSADCDCRSARCDGICIGNTQHVDGPEADDILNDAGHCHSNGNAGWSIHYTDADVAQNQVTPDDISSSADIRQTSLPHQVHKMENSGLWSYVIK